MRGDPPSAAPGLAGVIAVPGLPSRRPRDPLGDHDVAAAWALGVSKGSGKATSKPPHAEVRRLVALLDAHCADRDLVARARWAESEGEAYGEAARDRTRNVYKFGEWYENGRSFGAPRDAAPAPLRRVMPDRSNPADVRAAGTASHAEMEEAFRQVLDRNVIEG